MNNKELELVTESANKLSDDIINNDPYFVGIRFNKATKAYFFSTQLKDIPINTPIVVETIRGLELGYVSIPPLPVEKYKSEIALKPILRIATPIDIKMAEDNDTKNSEAQEICAQEIKKLGLDMNLLSAEYTLDKTKVTFSYLANERVDFRELLKVLATKLKCRIDLRQIGTRDKAKIVGGIGICGLQLCCSAFLNEFDGISINRAKNQLLSLNIPKLSGHCGKLICCLKYEDETYTEMKERFPKVGTKVFFNNEQYRITSMNVLSRIIKLEKSDNVQFLPLEEVLKLLKGSNLE